LKKAIKILGLFDFVVALFYLGYFALNAPVVINAVKAKLNPPTAAADSIASEINNAINNFPDSKDASNNIISDKKNSTADQNKKAEEFRAKFKNDWLYYPKLAIEAPIEWDVQTQNVKKLLSDELVHISGTGKPETGGEALIAGHSSYYWWSDGKYKDIFAPLTRAIRGDYVIIKRKNIAYVYSIDSLKQYSASTNIDVKYGAGDNKKILLMTCVPIGTNLKRLIVEANLVRQI
jgi:LPXTG-site transpeptidase (sortase) family protein